jgi:aspartate aminotransferase, mitochondrial
MLIRQVANSFSRSLAAQSGRSVAKKLNIKAGARCLSTESPWAKYEMAPFDPIIGLNEEYAKDDFPQKVIVGVGAYRDDAGKPYILPCVREAEDRLFSQHLDMEYSGIVRYLVLRLTACCGACSSID